MSITREQAATWFATTYPPGPAAREMYRMAAEAGVLVPCPQCESKEETT